MNVSRLVNFVAAILISGIQWTAFLDAAPHTQSVREAAAPLTEDVSDGSLPVVIVRAHRQS